MISVWNERCPQRKSLAAMRLLCVLLLLLLPLAAQAADQSETVTVDGQVRTFLVHLPSEAAPAGGFPVVLAFHGGGMQGAGMSRLTHLDTVADEMGFVVVYPDGIDRHWNDGRLSIKNPQNDVGFVAALLDKMERSYPVDRGRVYATGISNGALFAERLGCDLSERIAAIAPVAGTMPVAIAPTCRPARPVAVMQVDGTADPIMPYGGGAVQDFGGKGEGGLVQSVVETAAGWTRRDHCAALGTPEQLPPIAPLDPTRIVRSRDVGCPRDGQVTVLTVEGGGHTWPGGPQYLPVSVVGLASRQMDASRVIAEFFLSLPRRAAYGAADRP